MAPAPEEVLTAPEDITLVAEFHCATGAELFTVLYVLELFADFHMFWATALFLEGSQTALHRCEHTIISISQS